MEEMLFIFGLVTVFQVIGMVMLGTTLRGIIMALRQHGWRGICQVNLWWARLIVGGALVLITMLHGYAVLTTILKVLQTVIGLAVLVSSLIGIRGRLFSELQAQQVILFVFGAPFFIYGMVTTGRMLRRGEVFPALFVCLLFCGLGAALLYFGVKSLVDEE
jgi:hypothetical protein